MNANSPPPPESAPPPRIWTPLDLINWTKSFFEKKGLESPRLEAELLLAEVLGCARIRLYVDFEKPVDAAALAKFRDFVKRRGEKREPLQYIVGHTQFVDLKIKVTPAALIPRPETEILAVWAVDRAMEIATGTPHKPDPLDTLAQSAQPVRVLDLCTGTGCVALYVASKIPSARMIATDISKEALALAAENALALKQDARVVFLQGDLFAALNESAETEPFDIIVANPPYVDENSRAALQPEVRDFEPARALFAGESGTAIARRILAECDSRLKPGGWIGIEFGADQSKSIEEIAQRAGIFDTVKIEKDGAKLPRFLMARKKAALKI